jgi:hypothetical protein
MQTANNNQHMQSASLTTNNLFESFQSSSEQFNNMLPSQYVSNLNQLTTTNDSNNIGSCNEINSQFAYQSNNQGLVNLSFMQNSQQHQQHQQQPAVIQNGIKISNVN